jgi:hypothetical protein
MRSQIFRFLPVLAIACALVAPIAAHAQDDDPLRFPAPSPAAEVTQTVGLTEVEIVYARPAMRERQIFGGLVPYDAIWRTGANASTKITFSGPVVFGGAEVPAGTYALYSVPGRDEWQVILSGNTELWGSYGYDDSQEVARVKATPVTLTEPVESFTLSVDAVKDDAATLNIAWDTTRVPVSIVADTRAVLLPRIEEVMAGDGEEKPYFQAAMYLFSKGVQLDRAAEWIAKAAEAQPEAFWITYRQGLILEALGDDEGAIAAAERSLAAAQKEEGELKEEYTRLNEALIARVRGSM